MKNYFLFTIIALLLYSCGSDAVVENNTTTVEEKDTLSYEIKTFSKNSSTCAEDGNGCFTISYQYPYFTNENNALCDSLNLICCNLFAGTTKENNCNIDQKATEMLKEFDTYLQDEIGMTAGWYYEAGTEITFHTDSIISLSYSLGEYMGSAHPNSYQTELSYDKIKMKRLKPADVFTDLDKLNSIAEKYFREQQGISENESLTDAGFEFDNGFELNENFSLRKNGILFFFNNYEIGPYIMGSTEILIPYQDVNTILKSEFRFMSNKI